MRIAVTGSIATDYLMAFPGKFSELLIDGQLDKLSLSFLVDDLQIRRGGVAANIAFGLGRLGLRPVLVGAVGSDFDDYGSWLARHNVDTSFVHVSETAHTARFLCTTDSVNNQIASFYTGAMAEARLIELAPIADRLGGLDLVVVSPNDPDAMVRHTEESRQRGYRFIADPSQQLARTDGDVVRRLVDGAEYLFTNEYERELLLQKSGWSQKEVLTRVGTWVTTHGAAGVTIERMDTPTVEVAAVPPHAIAEPTGVGDAFRAGFLAGLAWRLPEPRAAQIGVTLATLVLESVGTQEYAFAPDDFLARLADTFGPDAAADIRPALTGTTLDRYDP